MKYKVGDKVKVRKDLEYGRFYPMEDGKHSQSVVEEMMHLGGTKATISRVFSDGDGYELKEDRFHYCWTDSMFELSKQIVIYQNGDEVIAYDKSSGEKAIAKCAPDDEFNFYVGARLAFSRLKQDHKFAIGDTVIGNDKADSQYAITGKGTIGTVTKVSLDGRFFDLEVSNDGLKRVFPNLYVDCFDAVLDIKELKTEKPWSATTLEEKREALHRYCVNRECSNCPLRPFTFACAPDIRTDNEVDLMYALAKLYEEKTNG